jgi:hypothetical protein
VSPVDLRWEADGLRTVLIENRHLRLVVLPELGARVDAMICKRADRDLLFHHPRVEPRRAPFGAEFDNWWSGGIDEGAPTGHACRVAGEQLPALGELWSLPWSVEQLDEHTVSFSRAAVITGLRITRTMRLAADATEVLMTHELQNTGSDPLQLLWGLHPVLPIGPATSVHVPAQGLEVGESGPAGFPASGSRAFGDQEPGCLRFEPEPTGSWRFDYAHDLSEGWLAVEDLAWNVGFRISFPREILTSVWIWAVDGGWRGLRCVGVEPWSGYPARLDQALAAGRVATIPGDATLRFETRLASYDPAHRPFGNREP